MAIRSRRHKFLVILAGLFTLFLLYKLRNSPDEEFKPKYLDYFIVAPENPTISGKQIAGYFLHNPKDICRSSLDRNAKTRTVLIVVHTARDNFNARASIRETFGSLKTLYDKDGSIWNFPLVFVIGTGSTSSAETEKLIDSEIQVFGDLIIADFVDSFRNLSLKHLAGLKWATEYCSSAEFYIKTDDDYLIDIFRAMKLMNSIPVNSTNFYCMAAKKWRPTRDTNEKYCVSRSEYPWNVFPTFCTGLYITRMKTIRRIYAASSQLKILHLEDVYVTGLIREYVNRELLARNQATGTELERPIGIINKLSHHTLFSRIEANFKNSSYIEIYTGREAKRRCVVWKAVLSVHHLSDWYNASCAQNDDNEFMSLIFGINYGSSY